MTTIISKQEELIHNQRELIRNYELLVANFDKRDERLGKYLKAILDLVSSDNQDSNRLGIEHLTKLVNKYHNKAKV